MYIGLTVQVRGAAIWTATRAGTDRPPLPDVQIGKPDGRQEKGGRRAFTGKDYWVRSPGATAWAEKSREG